MPEKKTTNSIHEEHRARMQERVARDGLTSLAAHEVLEYLLYFSIPRRDTNPLAHRLIQHFGGFCQVLDASEEELMQVQGIGPASARLLHSFRDVARFYQIQKHKEHPVQLRNAEMCCEYIRPLFSDPKREEFYMIAMNDDYVPLKEIYIASGIPNRVQFDTHKLLRDAVASQCTCVVLAHNHPSGLAAASNADLLATQAIILALGQVGIDVLDHVILTPTDWFSMAVCRSITPAPANCCLPPVPPGRWNRRSPNKSSAECASSTKQTRHAPRAQGSRVCLEPYKTKKCRPVKGAAKLCRLCGAYVKFKLPAYASGISTPYPPSARR